MNSRLILLALACLLVAAPATAQVNYAVSGNTAYVASSPNASGDIVIASTFNGFPVSSIGSLAFTNCTSLTSVTIPNSVTNIGAYAFTRCTSLTNMTVPNSVTSIGYRAFRECWSLRNVSIPPGVTSIAPDLIGVCTNLMNISVDAANPAYSSLDGVLFNKAQTDLIAFPGGRGSYVVPAGVTSIGDSAFSYCTLTNLTIANSVTSIGAFAFFRCANLTNFTFQGNAPGYGGNAFNNVGPGAKVYYYCGTTGWGVTYGGLPTVMLCPQVNYAVSGSTAYVTSSPNASGNIVISSTFNGYPVTSIGAGAFQNCTSLTSVTIPNGVIGIGGDAFSGCTGLMSVTIPNSVTFIWSGAFYNCTSLTNVVIPNSVTSIGYLAFSACTNLTDLSVDAANPAYSSVDGVLFNKAQTTLVIFPPSRGSYVIPDSVTTIGQQAFRFCNNLTTVAIPNGVTNIESRAFDGCTRLTSVTIPDSVTMIGQAAFEFCVRLTNVVIGNSVNGISWDAFSNCTNLTSVTIPNSATFIGDRAFEFCTRLTSVTIPNSVNRIGGAAFYACASLASVTIPNGVTRIWESTFARCTSLTSVTIPNSVTYIEVYAFNGCTRLTNFTFLGNAPQLEPNFGVLDQFGAVGAAAKVYYYCGTTGWGATYGGLPTVMLCPPGIASAGAGVKPGGFGFTLTRLTNQTIVVEASSDLLNWLPIWTNPPPGISPEFVDPEWLNHSNRFYRARSE